MTSNRFSFFKQVSQEEPEPIKGTSPAPTTPDKIPPFSSLKKIIKEKTSTPYIKRYENTLHGFFDGAYLGESIETYTTDNDFASQQNFIDHEHYAITFAMIFVMAFASTMVHRFNFNEEEKQKFLKKYGALMILLLKLQIIWPYFRDGLSGVKNGRHAYVTLYSLIAGFIHVSVHALLPISLLIGGLLAVNLIWFRRMRKKRCELIQRLKTEKFTEQELEELIPSHLQSSLRYASATFDGLTDGLYVMGYIITIMLLFKINMLTLGIPIIVTAIAIGLWTLISVVAKVTREYNEQQELLNAINDASTNKQDITPEYYSKTIHKLWDIGRSMSNCIKNFHSAINAFASLICTQTLNAVSKVMGVLIAGIVGGVIYGCARLYRKLVWEKPKEEIKDNNENDFSLKIKRYYYKHFSFFPEAKEAKHSEELSTRPSLRMVI